MDRRKHILSWFFISLLFFTNLQMSVMHGLYALDRGLFIELFCENKDQPDMHCDGTCMLGKMADHEHHDHSDMPPIQTVFQIQLAFYAVDLKFDLNPIQEATESPFGYVNHYSYQPTTNPYHPPIFV